MKITCPLEVEVLIKYHCDPEPDIDLTAPAYRDTVEKFISLGILIKNARGEIKPNREATQAFMNKLEQIVLPAQKWI